ncbi:MULTISPECIES: tRNA lysidine(34) synthetase TilS [Winogradskyella]|uniref:tRNA lysidine(34) synthetase TilS n=1 Tax=Winogradskyella TaxID=286104 RepID=UPI0015C6F36E|nr:MULTISPECIES: tRNA lysidine(34) synthetase TilS [Winogradskyella]QXP78907.1 tRNA lysidine(34) synthetase TilS [Winogradskyella sp. HaHa_3_26]
MYKDFKNHIENKLSILKESKLIIAISGGIDSVVLAKLCQSLELNFALAHCNFNLRAKESDKDEAFVVALAEELEVEVFVQNFDTLAYADQNKCSIQMAARELRYDWFAELAQQLNYDYILTAHHADDNLETFLINFTRGTGLNGLTGIPMINRNIVRPLLPFSRHQIEAFTQKENITWREDASNASRKYLRNKLRHEVVPVLKQINPNLLDSFQNTLTNLSDTAAIVEESLSAVLKRALVSKDENGNTYRVSEFKKLNNPKAYLFEIFKDYGFTEWNDIVDLLDAESGKLIQSNSHRLIKHREFLILTGLKDSELSEVRILITEQDSEVEIPSGTLIIQPIESIDSENDNALYIDKEKVSFPLELRLWREGDFFQPLGMNGKKKLSKYLKDEKFSLVEKENTWLLTSNKNVVWVVGKRTDDRFKVTKSTHSILKIEFKS